MSEENNEKLCGICDNKPSKYCCPRCQILYCSLDCYKSDKHQQCSESFYKECVNQELALNTVDNETKNKMIDILNRMQGTDSTVDNEDAESIDSDDEEHVDLQTRLQNVNLEDADTLWDALTDDERNEFQALLNGSSIGDIVQHWEPWWMYRKDKKLVEDIKVSSNEKDFMKKCPTIKSVPKFSSLTSVKPAPTIRVNIINVLAAYAFIMRYFNGEVDPLEATVCTLNICDNLNSNSNFDDPELAVEAVTQKCLQSDLIETDEESLQLMRHDSYLLYQGPSEDDSLFYTKSALSDLIKIFTGAKTQSKTPKTNESKNKGSFSRKFPEYDKSHLPPLDLSKLKKCIKKIEFYLSFLNTCDK